MIQSLIAFAADNDLTKAVDSVLPGGIANIFNFGLAVGALLAFGTIIYAGILYSSSGDNPSKQKEARAWIMAAVQGLGLIALSFVILRTINPSLTTTKPIVLTPVPTISYSDMTPLSNFTPSNFTDLSGAGFVSPLASINIGNSVYGIRCHPISKCCSPHRGIDLSPGCNAPIKAMKGGTFHGKNDPDGFGNYVVVDHGDGYMSYYAHMSRFAYGLDNGDYVSAGQTIGYVGTTGSSTGCHLHLEIRKSDGTDININGLFGAQSKQATMEARCAPSGDCPRKSCN